jgi:hypothetical protein
MTSGDGDVLFGDWDSVRPFTISNVLMARAVRRLIDSKLLIESYIENEDPQYQTPRVSISDQGIELFESALQELDIPLSEIEGSKDGIPDVLIEHLNGEAGVALNFTSNESVSSKGFLAPATEKDDVPASDRIVRRDDNSAAFDEAVHTLDEAISAVAKANDIGDLTAGERDLVLSQLHEGRKLFDLAEIKVSAIRALVEPKLRWLADKAAGAVVGNLALAALAAIAKLMVM